MIMKKIIWVFILIGFLSSFATAIDLSSSFLEVGKELSVYGNWFGDSPGKYWWICFDDDSHCFVKWSDWLILRSDKLIKILIPSNISLKWKIKIYVNSNLIAMSDYVIKPVIIDVSDWTYIKNFGSQWDKILIQGKWFWSYPGNVYFWNNKANILSWTDNKIWLSIPIVKTATTSFKIENSVWVFSELFKFNIYPKLSNDEYSSKQWYLSILGIQDIWKNYKKLWDWVIVAVMDVWVKINHPDLIDNAWINKKEIPGNWIDDDRNWYVDDLFWWNFVSNSNDMAIKSDHGTMIAGIIAAKKDNWIWIAWIAPNSKIMTLKVFDDTLKTVYNIQEAVKYAVDNWAKIINVSFGTDDLGRYEKDFDKFFQYAYDNWVVLTVAAGNTLDKTKQNLDKYPSSPVCNDWNKNYVIWVTSVNNQKIKSDFSRYWANCIDVAAPWENIFSLSDKKFNSWTINYSNQQWTSFATPIVAWAIALLRSNKPHLNNVDIYKALKETSDNIDSINLNYKWKLWKFINIKKLMERGTGSEKPKIEIGSGIDKKALTMFINIQAQMKNYSENKKQSTYKSIYAKLDETTQNWKYIKYIEDLKNLLKGEIK